MEYDVTIVECITIEKLKYYYTKKQLVKKINSNLKELCKKWNIKAELLSDADRYKKGECYYATIDWKRQTDEDLKLIAFNAESMVLALTEKRKNLRMEQDISYEILWDKNNVSKPWQILGKIDELNRDCNW